MMIRNLEPRLHERGKIKIGMRGAVRRSAKGNDYQLPQKLDHFVVTTMDKGDDGNFTPDPYAAQLFGAKPRSLPVMLRFDDPERNFMSSYACYVGTKLWCRGDGREAMRANGTSGSTIPVPCTCERIQPNWGAEERKQRRQGFDPCKFNGNLSVVLRGMPGVGGIWSFRTTSYNSVVSLMSALAEFKLITGGPLAGIPLDLVLYDKKVDSPDGSGQQTIHYVTLEFPSTTEDLEALGVARLRRQLDHGINIKMLQAECAKLLLPSPDSSVFDGETDEDIATEFYPESEVVDPETGEVTAAAAATTDKEKAPADPAFGAIQAATATATAAAPAAATSNDVGEPSEKRPADGTGGEGASEAEGESAVKDQPPVAAQVEPEPAKVEPEPAQEAAPPGHWRLGEMVKSKGHPIGLYNPDTVETRYFATGAAWCAAICEIGGTTEDAQRVWTTNHNVFGVIEQHRPEDAAHLKATKAFFSSIGVRV
ncbi:MAG: hypothetical protein IPK75_18805 [Acidobacteria bacterium]|nr:hypothetical protein [Acidobacteriota bacterium]